MFLLCNTIYSVFSSCATNMKYGQCICQTTCEDPNGESGCHRTCSGNEGCICPDGFSLNGTDCIRLNECECFTREGNLVIPVSFFNVHIIIM